MRYLTPHSILPVALVVAVLYLTPRRQHFEQHSHDLINDLPSDQIGTLDGLAFDLKAFLARDRAFQLASEGYPGALRRLRVTHTYLRLVWAFFSTGHLTLAHSRVVWLAAVLQMFYTVLAAPEAVLCWLGAPLPHIFGYLAFDRFREIALHCEVALSSSGAANCTLRLKDLL